MQTTGYIIDEKNNTKILILARQGKYGRYLKKRISGKEGVHFIDEEIFLNSTSGEELLVKLKQEIKIVC